MSTFESPQGGLSLAGPGAVPGLTVVLVVLVVSAAVHAPLSPGVRERDALAVGAFGVFWVVEGAGADWPGGDLAIVAILVFVTAVALANVRLLRGQRARELAVGSPI